MISTLNNGKHTIPIGKLPKLALQTILGFSCLVNLAWAGGNTAIQTEISAWSGLSRIEFSWSGAHQGDSASWQDSGSAAGADLALKAIIHKDAGLTLRFSGWLSNSAITATEGVHKFTARLPFGGEAMVLASLQPNEITTIEAGLGIAGARLELDTYRNQTVYITSWTNTWGVAYYGSIRINLAAGWQTGAGISLTRYATQSWRGANELEPEHARLSLSFGYSW